MAWEQGCWDLKSTAEGDVQQPFYAWKPAEQEGIICSLWLWLISLKGEGINYSKEDWAIRKTLEIVRVVKQSIA